MKLGAQFYSIRDKAKNPEEIRNSFIEMKRIGYESVQLSGIGEISAEELRDISLETALPIVCTHINPELIKANIKKIIDEHKIYGCPVIGIGSMPTEYRGSYEGVKAFIKDFSPIANVARDAGLKFAYHNHAFEFEKHNGRSIYDVLIEDFESVDFIIDTYWMKYAGENFLKYIKLIGNERTNNIHFKDMKCEPRGEICPCGQGVIDFTPVIKLCDTLGIENALVEQDNAPDTNDSYGQMAISYENLIKLFK